MAINFPNPAASPYTYNGKTWEWNGKAWVVVSSTGTQISNYVSFFNGLTGSVGISAGNNITIDQTGKTFTINSTATSGGIVGDYVKFINGLTSGITFFNGTGISLNFSSTGITFLSTIPTIENTFTEIQNFSKGISASGATFTGSIILQNAESIRNNINGSIDLYPNPTTSSGSTLWGIRFDMSSSGSGVRLNLIKAETGQVGVTSQTNNFEFKRPLKLDNDMDFNFGSSSLSKIRYYTTIQTGPSAGYTGLASLNIGIPSETSQSSGAVSIMKFSHFDTVGRIIGTAHIDPNLYIFSGDNGQTLDFIRFEHDRTDGNIVVGQGNLNINATSVNIPNLNIVDGGVY